MEFIALEPVGLAAEFFKCEGALTGNGRIRAGGFNLSPVPTNSTQILFELVFYVKKRGGKVTITGLSDDIQNNNVINNQFFIK